MRVYPCFEARSAKQDAARVDAQGGRVRLGRKAVHLHRSCEKYISSEQTLQTEEQEN